MKLILLAYALFLSHQSFASVLNPNEIEDTALLAEVTQKDAQNQFHNLLELKEQIVFSPDQLAIYYQNGNVYSDARDIDLYSAYCKILYRGEAYESKRISGKGQLNELRLLNHHDRFPDYADSSAKIIGYAADILMTFDLIIDEPKHIAPAWVFCRTATNNDPSGTLPTDPKSLNVGFLKAMFGKHLVNLYYK